MISIIYSDKFLLHKTSDNHPKKPKRLRAIIEALGQQTDNPLLHWVEPNSRDLRKYLNNFHSSEYIQKVEDMANNGGGNFYEDTFVFSR